MNKKQLVSYVITAIVIAIIFFLFKYQAAYTYDDWMYKMICHKQGGTPTENIETLSDVFLSQYYHYNCVNGRAIVHILGQILLSLTPKYVCDIFISLLFMLNVVLLSRYAFSTKFGRSPWSLLVMAVGLFYMMPAHYDVTMWAIGAVNYMWSGVVILVTMLLWDYVRRNAVSRYWYIPLFLTGFVSGWSHEGIAAGLAAAFVCEILWGERKLLSVASYILMIGFCLGAVMLIASPGMWNRAEEMSAGKSDIVMSIVLLLLLFVMLVYALLGFARYGSFKVRSVMHRYKLPIVAGVVLITMLAVTDIYERVAWGIAFFLMMPLYRLFEIYVVPRIKFKSIKWIFLVLVLGYTSYLYIEHYKVETQQNEIIEKYRTSDDGIVVYDCISPSGLTSSYVFDPRSIYSSDLYRYMLSIYSRKPKLQLISSDVYHILTHSDEFLTPENKVEGTAELYSIDNFDYYVRRYSKDFPDYLHCFYGPVSFSDNVSILGKIRRGLMPQYYPTQAYEKMLVTTYHLPEGSFMLFYKTDVFDIVKIDMP